VVKGTNYDPISAGGQRATDKPNDVRAGAMSGLELALRHGAARSMPLRVQFYRTIASAVRTLCQGRQSHGLPPELIVLLSTVRADAARRLPADPTDSLALGLHDAIEKLRQAIVFSLLEQRKAKNPRLRWQRHVEGQRVRSRRRPASVRRASLYARVLRPALATR
jgi:hypothetical protein